MFSLGQTFPMFQTYKMHKDTFAKLWIMLHSHQKIVSGNKEGKGSTAYQIARNTLLTKCQNYNQPYFWCTTETLVSAPNVH